MEKGLSLSSEAVINLMLRIRFTPPDIDAVNENIKFILGQGYVPFVIVTCFFLILPLFSVIITIW